MNEKKGGPLFGIGGVTLLTVLLILCLTLFSVLALSSAQADLRLSEKNARTITAYYSAENQAYEIIRLAEEIWLEEDRRPPLSAFSSGFSSVREVKVEAADEAIRISADIPIQENSYLRVVLLLKAKSDGNTSRWEIIQWQMLPPVQDEADIAFLPLFIP